MAEILKKTESDLRNSDASFFFVYLCEMDMFLHLHCHGAWGNRQEIEMV